jgi:hypothetical protein
MIVFGLGLAATSCRKPVDPCAKVKCYNDGKCIDGKCKCPEGWTGPDCREPKRKP